MSELIFLVEESQDGGYIAKALGASIYTESNTYEEIKEAIKDAVVCHYEDGSAPNSPPLLLLRRFPHMY